MKKCLCMSGAIFATTALFASGFALYQPSAVAHAMGGALVGKAMDASANFNNPATLTDLTNMEVTVGFVTEHPRGRVKAGRFGGFQRDFPMDPGMFVLPHIQLAMPLPAGFTFGLGMEPEFGLGTQYDDGWLMNFSAAETTIESFVINPNIAYKVTDDWSVAVGLRWTYLQFEQYSFPQVEQGGMELARFSNRLRGDNGAKDFGWQIGTKYDVTDTFSVGGVYKSAIDVSVDGKTENNVFSWSPIAMAYPAIRDTVSSAARMRTGAASAEITLPQSVALGCNWDILPVWHVGAMVSWTQWSEFDNLHFDLQGGNKNIRLDWRDTWRTSVGSCWEFARGWKWMASYTYDMDSTQSTQQSAMLPPSDRHIVGTGLSWNCWEGLELTLSYACIFMDGRDMRISDSLGRMYSLKTEWGYCHAAGLSVTYRF